MQGYRDDEGREQGAEQLERRRVQQALRAKMFGVKPEPVHVGRFEIRRRLGAGAMGVVYAAYDPQLQREVALKVIAGVSLPERDSFLHEARALARLAHPNVLQIHEAGVHDGAPYLVSELVDGGTFRAWLSEAERPWRETLALLIAAGHGLLVAHQRGLTHRDIKPENLLVGADGRPRIADFGLALSAGPAQGALGPGVIAGTLRYMAPEQRRGERVDPSSDQFSFCVMAFEALFGRVPFEGSTDAEILAATEAGALASIPARHPASGALAPLRRGLSAAPSSRYPSMAELLADLETSPARSRRLGPPLALAAAVALLATGVAAARGLSPPAPAVAPAQPPPRAPFTQARPASSQDEFDPYRSPLWGARICLETCVEPVHDARELYLSWASEASGPTGSERTIRGVTSLGGCDACKKHLRVEDLSGGLAEAAGPLLAAVDQLLPVSAEAERYYEQSLYKDDRMATGRRLHAPLLAAYSAVDRAGRAFRAQALLVEATEQQRLPALLRAPALELLRAGGREVSKIDPASLEASLLSFEQALAASPPPDTFQRDTAAALAVAGRELLRRRQTSRPFPPGQQGDLGSSRGHSIPGSPDQLVDAYHAFARHRDLLIPCRHYLSRSPEP